MCGGGGDGDAYSYDKTNNAPPNSHKNTTNNKKTLKVLTATFLGIRLYCSFMMEYDIHTLLDALTFVATGAVLYSMLAPSQVAASYQPDLDSVKWYLVLAPCFGLAVFAHPTTSHWLPFRILWAGCVYLEAVSVFPQLRMMQKAKVVERFTAHYVFCLGLSRFFSCAHWILQVCCWVVCVVFDCCVVGLCVLVHVAGRLRPLPTDPPNPTNQTNNQTKKPSCSRATSTSTARSAAACGRSWCC